MKTKLVICFLISLFASDYVAAYSCPPHGCARAVHVRRAVAPPCNTCRPPVMYAQEDCACMGSGFDSCGSCFKPSCYSCACADITCNTHACMSPCRYCRVFGNIGGTEFEDDIY